MIQRLRTTATLAAVVLGGVLMAGAAVAHETGTGSAWEPKPFHATGDVRSVDVSTMRLEMKSRTARRHFRTYALAPGVTVRSPQGPVTMSALAPKMHVRLIGTLDPADTWIVNQIEILPRGVRDPFPKPFDATGEVRSLDPVTDRLELKARPSSRHFHVYVLDPAVAVETPHGPASLSDVTPRMRVRVIGEREADRTSTVDQIQILPER
jgi:hypothetical protein